jgi:hypothetical protein
VYLSVDFNYITSDEAEQMLVEIEETSKVLNSYINSIKTRQQWDD